MSSAEAKRLERILEERNQLAEIVASVMRGARQDRDVKQAKMGHGLGRSADAISNMEQLRTDFSLPDAILWVRELDSNPEHLRAVFERLLFEVGRFYQRRAK